MRDAHDVALALKNIPEVFPILVSYQGLFASVPGQLIYVCAGTVDNHPQKAVSGRKSGEYRLYGNVYGPKTVPWGTPESMDRARICTIHHNPLFSITWEFRYPIMDSANYVNRIQIYQGDDCKARH